MAKPALDEKHVEEILRAFAFHLEGGVPTKALMKALSKASGMMESAILHRFKQLYNEARGTADDDPYGPLSLTSG